MFHHKQSSIGNKINISMKKQLIKNINSLQQQQQWFIPTRMQSVPMIVKSHIQLLPSSSRNIPIKLQDIQQLNNILKLQSVRHNWMIAFCLSFMNLYFTNIKKFIQNVQKMYEILDRDEFLFMRTQDKSSKYFMQWSNSKIKRVIVEYMTRLISGERKYKSLLQILQQVDGQQCELMKIMCIFSMSMLHNSRKIVNNYNEIISFETVKQALFDYFDISVNIKKHQHQNINNNCIVSKIDAGIYVYQLYDRDMYIVINSQQYQSNHHNHHYQNQQQHMSTSIDVNTNSNSNDNNSIKLSNVSSIDSQPYNSNSNINNKEQILQFDDLTNQICNAHHQYYSSINTYSNKDSNNGNKMSLNMNNNNKHLQSMQINNKDFQQHQINNNKQNHTLLSTNHNNNNKYINNSNNKTLLSTQCTSHSCNDNNNKNIYKQQQQQLNQLQTQSQIDRLFQHKSHQATTQKSIYDNQQQATTPEQQYSFIDQDIPSTSRKNTQRKTIIKQHNQNISHNQQQNLNEYLQPSQQKTKNQTLMTKWYQFIKLKKNHHTNNNNNNTKDNTKDNKQTPKTTIASSPILLLTPNTIQQKLQPQTKTTTTIKILTNNTNNNHIPTPTRLTSTQKPDFKKIKSSRRRNTQMSQSQQRQLITTKIINKNNNNNNLLTSIKSQTNLNNNNNTPSFLFTSTNNIRQSSPSIKTTTTTLKIDKPPRLSIQQSYTNKKQRSTINPLRMSLEFISNKNINRNSSPYALQMKVTQQFTDSVILGQINQKNQNNIKLMKQKARKQRNSTGCNVSYSNNKQRKTVK